MQNIDKIINELLNKKQLKECHLINSPFNDFFIAIKDYLQITNIRQILWHASNGTIIPKCKCSNNLSWHPDKRCYRIYCSKRCSGEYGCKKAKYTNLARYGVTHFSKTSAFNEKTKQANQDKFGVDYYSQTDECKQRVVKTNLKNLGVEHPAQDKTIYEKTKQTNLKKYGVEYTGQIIDTRIRAKQTMIEKYGLENPWLAPEIREKSKQTCLDKYGVEYSNQRPGVAANSSDKVKRKHYTEYTYEKLHDPKWLEYENKHGKSIADIAKELHVTPHRVYVYFKRHNIEIRKYFRSQIEKELFEHYINLGINVISQDRAKLKGTEIDLYFPDHNFGVELNGAFYHSERNGKLQFAHLNKTNKAINSGIQLLQFFDWELVTQKNIILNKINHHLKLNPLIDLNTLRITKLNKNDADNFFNINHHRGIQNYTIIYGLVDSQNNVTSAMAFKKNSNWELLAFANKLYAYVPGAADELFSHFVKNNGNKNDQIYSHSDRRWSNGDTLYNLGFKLKNNLDPSFFAVTKNGTYMCTENDLKSNQIFSHIEFENNYTKVWDCGQQIFAFTVK